MKRLVVRVTPGYSHWNWTLTLSCGHRYIVSRIRKPTRKHHDCGVCENERNAKK